MRPPAPPRSAGPVSAASRGPDPSGSNCCTSDRVADVVGEASAIRVRAAVVSNRHRLERAFVHVRSSRERSPGARGLGGELSAKWPVKLTVTPIGGQGRSASTAARAVVRHLSGMAKDPAIGSTVHSRRRSGSTRSQPRDIEAMIAAARDPHSIPADSTTIATTETPNGTFIADGEISQLFEASRPGGHRGRRA